MQLFFIIIRLTKTRFANKKAFLAFTSKTITHSQPPTINIDKIYIIVSYLSSASQKRVRFTHLQKKRCASKTTRLEDCKVRKVSKDSKDWRDGALDF